ncbi:hypothetical protein DFH11DRAFT_1830161 [Phellopilus nigrolimitatus]|nr:hypothetical protein DFH11DRAFT_1830161 [Phellopilus nigrolimitatus]
MPDDGQQRHQPGHKLSLDGQLLPPYLSDNILHSSQDAMDALIAAYSAQALALICPTAVRPRSLLRDHTLCCSLGLFCSVRLAVELEKKVAKITTKRCSTGEVQALQKELLEWLGVDRTKHGSDQQQHTAIQLSDLLLRAILMNHIAHSEAAKVAKGTEQQLRSRLVDGDLICKKLNSDLCWHKNLLATKAQVAEPLRADQPRRLLLLLRVHLRPVHPTSNPGLGASSPASSGRTMPTAGLVLAPGPSPMFFPGSPNGTSSASATAAALQHPASRAYHHTRSASMMQHCAMMPAPAVHAVFSVSSTLGNGSRGCAMKPAPVRQRSASQAAVYETLSGKVLRDVSATRLIIPVSSASILDPSSASAIALDPLSMSVLDLDPQSVSVLDLDPLCSSSILDLSQCSTAILYLLRNNIGR